MLDSLTFSLRRFFKVKIYATLFRLLNNKNKVIVASLPSELNKHVHKLMPYNATQREMNEAYARIEQLKIESMKRVGEKGFNPFIWIKDNLEGLDLSLKENCSAVMNLTVPKQK